MVFLREKYHMKFYVILVVFCVVFLIILNIVALHTFSPVVSKNDHGCQQTIENLQNAIDRLKQELAQKTSSQSSPSPALSSRDSHVMIHMITPTYARWTQKADLTRLCQTLMHVRNLHWIVIEDSENETDLVRRFLERCTVNSTHLHIRTKKELQRNSNEPIWRKNRGVEQRNKGLEWLRTHYKPDHTNSDVVYFGDDDNTYDIHLFDEIRATKKLSVWPVGICGGLKWEGPICSNGKVKAWHTSWAKQRSFPIDFAGFAISLQLILMYSSVDINPQSNIGWLESDFLSQIITPWEAEAGADNCTKVLVWHTRTEKPKTKDEDKLIAQGRPSNPQIEV